MKKIKSPVQFLALLRGINVGGKNIIKMTDLKSCFESMGFSDVVTYIQSGNIIFNSDNKSKLLERIEKTLSKTFNYDAKAVVISYKDLKNVVENALKDFGKESSKYRYDVIFLKDPLTVKEAMKNIKVKEGVDNAYEGKNVIYFRRLIAKASQSYLSKIITLPVYKNMTIRNWNTTTKLLTLMEKG
jgi:uncharacterized protein (DUF1697 family)